MTTRTLPLDADDEAIRALVVEWSEFLAQGRFAEAMQMFPSSEESSIHTPRELEQTIAGYEWAEPYPSGERFAVSALHRPYLEAERLGESFS